MGKNDNFNDEDEVMIFVDEDGNELFIEDERDIMNPDNVEDVLNKQGEVELEEDYELEEPVYEDYDVEYDNEEEPGENFFSGAANKMVLLLGAAVIVIALVLVGVFVFSKKTKVPKGADKVDFSSLGSNVATIGVIGEENIYKIAEAESARLDELYDAQRSYAYDEADQEDGISSVSITLTSILNDLKIKIVNSKDKLIGNVPFEVEVTYPDGKKETWEDDNKDGIIYKTDLPGGKYKVRIIPLNGYDSMYDFSTATIQTLSVKTELEYKKVDVKNEIKSAKQVDAKEDAAQKETEVESKLKDTVTYLMSEKKASSNGYEAISKNSIADPLVALTQKNEASIGRFKRLSAGPQNMTEPEDPSSSNPGGDVSPSDPGGDVSPSDPTPSHTHSFSTEWSVDETEKQHYHQCSGCSEKADVAACTLKYVTSNGKHKQICEVCGHEYEAETPCVDEDHDGKCDVCHADMPAGTVTALTLAVPTNASTISVKGAVKSTTLSATAEVTPSNATVTYQWSIKEGTDIIELSNTGTATVTITAKKAGTAKVKCVATAGTITKESEASIVVTDGAAITLDRTAKKAMFVGGDTFTVKATSKGGTTNKVTWSCSDTNIATIKQADPTGSTTELTTAVTVTAVKPGTVTLTATSVDDNQIKATITVVVATHPKDDKSTKLVDTSGKQVYVYNSSSKKYEEATYANYYTGETLYTPVDVTYVYNGWWTIDGKTYYFDSNGKKVTGEQVILGAKYSFDSNGVLKSGTGLFGIDVSTWNGTIDWKKVAKSGVSYAIIRCGYRGSTIGGLVQDDRFASNIKNATDAGIKVGVYFFTQAVSEAEAIEEASMCLSLVEGYKLTYPIFLDVESAKDGRANGLNKDQRTSIVNAFCKTITNSGYKAGVYANKNWFTNYLKAADLTSYTIWLAQYASAPTYTATRYDLWQYSSQGSIGGISGNVDLDLSYLGY